MPWSIKDEVSNIPPEGSYLMRIEKIEGGLSKNGEPVAKFQTVIVGGADDLEGKKQFYSRSLQKKYLKFIAVDLANSQTIDQDSDEATSMPDDPQSIVEALKELLENKVFRYELTTKGEGAQKQANWTLSGPNGSI